MQGFCSRGSNYFCAQVTDPNLERGPNLHRRRLCGVSLISPIRFPSTTRQQLVSRKTKPLTSVPSRFGERRPEGKKFASRLEDDSWRFKEQSALGPTPLF